MPLTVAAHTNKVPFWVTRAPGVPYFMTDDGEPWHPIGQNDAVTWHELGPLYRRRDVAQVEAHLRWLVEHGVTCLRMMLEYAQERHRYFETGFVRGGTATSASSEMQPKWSPGMVRFWDDLFALCEKVGLRLLLTPYDTFWMWIKWKQHPYNQKLGGVLRHPSEALLSAEMRTAIKARLTFAAERWGGSGALFAWDLWNEIHPAHAKDEAAPFRGFIDDLSQHVREVETRKWGRAHLQTVSLFGPELGWKPHLRAEMEEAIFRHPALDFATIHIYQHGTIDDPKNTVDAAVDMGRHVREAVLQVRDARPFLDTEHGPIHRYKDKRVTLPEAFDDEYFRHMQWAHLASGGAGGGMRWPNRSPHSLTPGMRRAQAALAGFLPFLDWLRFDRGNVTDELRVWGPRGEVAADKVARFGCADVDQAVVYLLRRDVRRRGEIIRKDRPALRLRVWVPGLREGRYQVVCWDTVGGRMVSTDEQELGGERACDVAGVLGDMAVALREVGMPRRLVEPRSELSDPDPSSTGLQEPLQGMLFGKDQPVAIVEC